MKTRLKGLLTTLAVVAALSIAGGASLNGF
jgi:hypothetical protein